MNFLNFQLQVTCPDEFGHPLRTYILTFLTIIRFELKRKCTFLLELVMLLFLISGNKKKLNRINLFPDYSSYYLTTVIPCL